MSITTDELLRRAIIEAAVWVVDAERESPLRSLAEAIEALDAAVSAARKAGVVLP